MNILVNTTNLSAGGGLQVADSFCSTLNRYEQHNFVVVLSSYLHSTKEKIKHYSNVEVFEYDIKNNIQTIVFGRDRFLDSLVRDKKTDAVVTIFGPSRWNPKNVFHLSGFAMSQLVLKESPFFSIIPLKEKLKWKFGNFVRKYLFARSTKVFFSENQLISDRVEQLFKNSKCYTITNYYNQVFEEIEASSNKLNLAFNLLKRRSDEIVLLNISTPYLFKNLPIAIDIAKELKNKHKDLNFRFVFTCKESDFPPIEKELKDCFCFLGKVAFEECPNLYKQCDIVFHPTLLECFSAVYPEAMKMQKPIVTTDLPFAHSLCGDAALYYSPLSAQDAAEKIYTLSQSVELQKDLIQKGERQLEKYDTYIQRSEKIIKVLESYV
ncbi:MAG: glycosyltransferase [Bacteroidales bacterium]|nr:glycosyltransferase [Bacteroidales bacterium]